MIMSHDVLLALPGFGMAPFTQVSPKEGTAYLAPDRCVKA
jgi:hypothetical protein